MSNHGRSQADSWLQFKSDKTWTAVSIFAARCSAVWPKSSDYKTDFAEGPWIKYIIRIWTLITLKMDNATVVSAQGWQNFKNIALTICCLLRYCSNLISLPACPNKAYIGLIFPYRTRTEPICNPTNSHWNAGLTHHTEDGQGW